MRILKVVAVALALSSTAHADEWGDVTEEVRNFQDKGEFGEEALTGKNDWFVFEFDLENSGDVVLNPNGNFVAGVDTIGSGEMEIGLSSNGQKFDGKLQIKTRDFPAGDKNWTNYGQLQFSPAGSTVSGTEEPLELLMDAITELNEDGKLRVKVKQKFEGNKNLKFSNAVLKAYRADAPLNASALPFILGVFGLALVRRRK